MLRLREEHREEFGRVLEVGVHDADVPPARHAQTRNDGGAQAALSIGALAEQAADRGLCPRQLDGRLLLRQREEQICRAVVAVVDETDFEARPRERRADAVNQRPDVARLVARRDHQADDRRGPARLFGSHGQRIGAKCATRSRSSRFGVAPGDGPGDAGQLRCWWRRAAR